MEQQILRSIEPLAEVLNGHRVLLVCGNSFDRLELGGFGKGPGFVRFSGFSPNPDYEDVCLGVELFRSAGCSAILAVGGGSAMDVAKCIKLFSAMDPSENYLKQEYRDSGILLAAVPTTAGTGSESTRHAVIYYRGEKQSVSHESLVPQVACLVPSLLKGLPVYQKKCTMLDALCQAIESWWSVSSTAESWEYSRTAIDTIGKHWKAYIRDNDAAAGEQILLAANYAGRAINITATTAAHAMSYKLTSLYGIPHGHAVALCLPEVWEYMLSATDRCTDNRGEKHLKEVFAQIPMTPDQFRALMDELQMTRPSSGHRERDLSILAGSVNPVRLKNNPVPLDEPTLKAMYERIVQ